jgi:hypothetical protein
MKESESSGLWVLQVHRTGAVQEPEYRGLDTRVITVCMYLVLADATCLLAGPW